MARLSEEQIQKILEVYAKVGTYAGTAKICGNSISTVKKYVELNFYKEPKSDKSKNQNKNIIFFNEEIPEIDKIKVPEYKERGNWLRLTEKEKEEIDILRGEL